MKRFILSLMTMAVVLATYGQSTVATKQNVGSFYYNFFSDNTCEVTWGGDSETAGTSTYTGKMTIPSSVTYNETSYDVTTIGEHAFHACTNLIYIEIPSSVSKVNTKAFYDCKSLKDIVVNRENAPSAPTDAFEGEYPVDTKVTVPEGAVQNYRTEVGWKRFSYTRELVDKEAYTQSAKDNFDQISYTRNFTNTTFQPLYVPFETTANVWEEKDMEVYGISKFHNDVDDSNEQLDIIKLSGDDEVPANTPLFVKAKSTGEKSIVVKNATLVKAASKTLNAVLAKGCSCIFTGIYNPTTVKNNWYVMSDGELCLPSSSSVTLGGFRWYLTIDGDPSIAAKAKIRINVIEDENTGIKEVAANRQKDDKTYTIDGRLVNSSDILPNGIYVRNGKKFIVK